MSNIGSQTLWHLPVDSYDRRAQEPIFWFSSAQQLRRATRLVWAGVQADIEKLKMMKQLTDEELSTSNIQFEIGVHGVVVFLGALAIENLLKASLVKKDLSVATNGKLRGKIITSHDLVRIAQEAKVSLDADELRFCELGKTAIESWGRYPLGKSVSATNGNIFLSFEIIEVFERLFSKLASDLKFPD
jgi:hypothetical protein